MDFICNFFTNSRIFLGFISKIKDNLVGTEFYWFIYAENRLIKIFPKVTSYQDRYLLLKLYFLFSVI